MIYVLYIYILVGLHQVIFLCDFTSLFFAYFILRKHVVKFEQNCNKTARRLGRRRIRHLVIGPGT
jgi:hypothetical protein